MDKQDQKFKPEFLSDYSPEPKNIRQQCRWVNVKNTLFIIEVFTGIKKVKI